ncbi:Fc receptor-like protein 3 [Chanos chanos]|uniref:Fc receptor-like protein 3 n=1 Tax=Chanos chanos TaxID=29144 RepID=A0A6J2VVL3_CHACN|nr:Fc receptor-like protein 3 [Chanos chanos]
MDDAEEGSSDMTYSQIVMKNMKIKNKDKTNTPQQDTVYSQLKSNTTTGDAEEGSSDVTYSQIVMKNMKIKNKEKTNRPEEDTVYSQLKSNTTTDCVVGPSDVTYVTYAPIVIKHKKNKKKNKGNISIMTEPVYSQLKHGSPKAVVILQPDKQTFRGETVTLRCQIQGERDTDWEYSWYKKSSSLSPVGKDQEYTISPVSESHGGEYTCRGKHRRDSQISEMSDAVTLTVSSGLSPPASLIISSNKTQHFTSDSLSLSCEVQSNSTGWTVRRYTDNGEVSSCSSDWGSVTGSTCSISSLQSSDSGVYWCQSDSGGNSNPLNITVTYGDVILESPVHPVTEGDTLTLHCRYRYDPSDLRADFYKDGSVLQNQTTGEMTIPTVSKSDEGLYWCKHPERGESPKSWITSQETQQHQSDSTPGSETDRGKRTADIYDTIESPCEGNRDLFSPLPSAVETFAGYLTSVGVVGSKVYLVAQ